MAQVSKGEVWLVGGFLYKRIVYDLYHRAISLPADIDFVVEEHERNGVFREGWAETKNMYGNPRYTKPGLVVDVMELRHIHSIVRRGVSPTIESYLSGVPLTMQSVAFQIQSKELIGEVGLSALEEQMVRVYNQEEAEDMAMRLRMTVAQYAGMKAAEVGFRCEF